MNNCRLASLIVAIVDIALSVLVTLLLFTGVLMLISGVNLDLYEKAFGRNLTAVDVVWVVIVALILVLLEIASVWAGVMLVKATKSDMRYEAEMKNAMRRARIWLPIKILVGILWLIDLILAACYTWFGFCLLYQVVVVYIVGRYICELKAGLGATIVGIWKI